MTPSYDLLLELGCEEIPSRFIHGAMAQLKQEAASILTENRLAYGKIEALATPRRLVLIVKNLEERQADLEEQIKGPPADRAYDEKGKPTKALEGFLKSRKASLADVKQEKLNGSLYVTLQQKTLGAPAEEILPKVLPALIGKLSFPRPMYWEENKIRFARPIRWILALYHDKPVSFVYAGVHAGSLTYGHRFLAPGPFEVQSIKDYFSCLEESFVILSQKRRREAIRKQLKLKAEEKNAKALIDEKLLEEVTYLVEYPVAIDGSFDPAFLDLPQEVPIVSMQSHQRYFPVVDKNSGKLLPYFIGISNNRFHEKIRQGYAKVLQARLADGRFFYDEDRKRSLEEHGERLKNVVFLESLGSLDKKRQRLSLLVQRLGTLLGFEQAVTKRAQRAAHLAKADLVTAMVKEFPELQGVMGREYARLSGEEEKVATAIFEHYLPRFAGDILPGSEEGALVSLADRLDTLAGCFAAGIEPTGSQDPYALRRQAQGVIAILLGLDLKLAPDAAACQALEVLAADLDLGEEEKEKLCRRLCEFLNHRIRFLLQEKKTEHEVIEAVLAVPFATVSGLFEKAAVLEDYLQGPLLDDVITAYNRVANLAKNALSTAVNKALFEDISEKELFRTMQAVENALKGAANPQERLEKLQLLRQPIDHFFDNVMVMTEDDALKNNRLNLLAALKKTFNQMADFSKLTAP